MTNNHTLFLSLYENPLAPGAIPTSLQVDTAEAVAETVRDDRLVGYLRRGRLDGEPAIELATVASMPNLPPRACAEISTVESMPNLPPRACTEFSAVVSMPNLPPRACAAFPTVESMPTLPPRA
jgi:hypothetical protein